MSMSVDGTGHAWHPQEGDRVKDIDSGEHGMVVQIHQRANDSAEVWVALRDDGAWRVVMRTADQLELDVEEQPAPSDAKESKKSIEQAACDLLAELVLLGQLRSRVQSSDELVAVLEIEADRCAAVAERRVDAHRYADAARERSREAKLRGLAESVGLVRAKAGYAG